MRTSITPGSRNAADAAVTGGTLSYRDANGFDVAALQTAGLAILATERPLAGFGGMMITHHVAPGMWEVEGLSNAAAASLRWFRDVVGTREREQEAAGGVPAYQAFDELAASGRGLRW